MKVPSFVAALSALFVSLASTSCADSSRRQVESSTYDRVMKSGAIRCGYIVYPPYCMKNPNTGKLSGIFVEATEQIGKRLGLKVLWSEEVGYESLFAGLQSNRYDIFAGGLWPSAEREKAGDFSVPLFYSVINAYVRPSETRFANLEDINLPTVKIAVIDGAMEDLIARQDFPKAKRLSLPQLSSFSQNLLNVVTGKADITFAEPGIVSLFLRSNPKSLKQLPLKRPLRMFGNAYVFKLGQKKFENLIDHTIGEILSDGQVEKLLEKYEPAPGVFRRIGLSPN
jgi:polar amino acid transport system substrate-binding protein